MQIQRQNLSNAKFNLKTSSCKNQYGLAKIEIASKKNEISKVDIV